VLLLLYQLATSLIITLFEVSSVYFITQSLIGVSMKKAVSELTVSRVLFALLIFSPVVIFPILENADYFVSIRFYIFIAALLFIIFYTTYKNAEPYGVDDVLLIFFIYFIISQVVVGAMRFPIIIFGLNHLTYIIFVLLLIIAKIAIILTLDKWQLSKFFIYISYRLAIKIAILALALAIMLIILVYSITNIAFNLPVVISLSLVVCLIIWGFMRSLKAAHQYEAVAPHRYEDLKLILSILHLNSLDANSVEEMKDMLDAAIDIMGVKIDKPVKNPVFENSEQFEAYVDSNIESLKLTVQSDIQIIKNIQFFESHHKVDNLNLSYLLTTLLENAIETQTTYPIFIDVLSTANLLFIKVANETPHKDEISIEKMFDNGYSTKNKVGRGFGLSKLKKTVDKLDGNINISQFNDPNHGVNYISFTLNF